MTQQCSSTEIRPMTNSASQNQEQLTNSCRYDPNLTSTRRQMIREMCNSCVYPLGRGWPGLGYHTESAKPELTQLSVHLYEVLRNSITNHFPCQSAYTINTIKMRRSEQSSSKLVASADSDSDRPGNLSEVIQSSLQSAPTSAFRFGTKILRREKP